ncbi:RPA-related protein RADX [Trichomycterus rosablanca]|uniref:RPA-related protein RADX n=1 Tax=Trichomycterus rosablanca TaxID=2290929 RepID=UPI002F35F792
MAAAESISGESDSVLDSVLNQLWCSRSLRFGPVSPLCVAVISIDRYLSDGRDSTDCYSYDVTITDGRCRVKCHLSAGLNRLVRTNALRSGWCVHISQFCIIHDERRLNHSYVCIEQVQIVSHDPAILPTIKDLDSVRWWYRDGIVQTDAPLKFNRKHYLSLWNNEDPHGTVWVSNTPPADVVIDVSRISLLADLDAFFASSRRPLPVLVRVLHRSRLRYYGKPGQNIDFPLQAYFEVADQSGVMSMVLWNDLCPEWYHRLTVGSVLYLQHYTLKRSYQNRSRPQLGALSLFSFSSIEICLNPRNPPAVITVISPKGVQPQWSLPDVTYKFSTRSEIESLASNQACDIIGLVTYVGRVERIRNRGNSVPVKFWTYRWVHAVDGTSEYPFILEIFASSQPEIFNNISPMTYLVCTQMRVCRETGSSVFLTSSTETQLFITGCHRKQPYVSEPKVKAFIQWTKTLKDSTVMRKTAVGGYYCYPPAPTTFTPNTTSTNTTNSTSSVGEAASLSLMAVGDLRRELESLQYRERRRVAVQGHICVVQYRQWPTEREQQLEQESASETRGSSPVSTDVPERSETPAAAPASHNTPSPKRRRVEEAVKAVQRQYWTRAKVQSDRQTKPASVEEDESQEGSTQSPQTTDNTETANVPDSEHPASRPVALWESSVWSSLKHDVADHISCPVLNTESVPERFSFDNRDVLLQRINLSPSKWSPDLPSDSHWDTHTAVEFPGYLTLTILGLNQEAAVDSLFLPVFTPEDPRAVGTSCSLHDDTLMSCLTAGRIHEHLSPASLLSSAPALEDQKVVCVLDVCLLSENKLEIICSKIYRAADIIPV